MHNVHTTLGERRELRPAHNLLFTSVISGESLALLHTECVTLVSSGTENPVQAFYPAPCLQS